MRAPSPLFSLSPIHLRCLCVVSDLSSPLRCSREANAERTCQLHLGLTIGPPTGPAEGPRGYETLSRLCVWQGPQVISVFRRPRSRRPIPSPCGAVLPSTSPAAGASLWRSPEVTPVSCGCFSPCRRRPKVNQTSQNTRLSGYVKKR